MKDSESRVYSSGFRVQGLGCRVLGRGFRLYIPAADTSQDDNADMPAHDSEPSRPAVEAQEVVERGQEYTRAYERTREGERGEAQ